MDNSSNIDLHELFSAIDRKDTDTFLDFLSEDAIFRFGSTPAVQGHDTIRAAVDGFFASIGGSKHQLLNTLADGALLVCEGEVCYRRLDETELTLPFTNVFETAGGLISCYKIYIDISPLYAE